MRYSFGGSDDSPQLLAQASDCGSLPIAVLGSRSREEGRKVIGHWEAPTPTQPLSNFALRDVAIAFLAVALARERGFDSLLLTRLQIESVSLYFLNDILLHNFALEATERVLKGFTILNVDLSQRSPPFFQSKGRPLC
jgi:hypothetical protein